MIPQSKIIKELEKRIETLEQTTAKTKFIRNCDLNELEKEGSGMFLAYSQVANAPSNTSNVHYHVIQNVYKVNDGVSYVLQIAVLMWRVPTEIHVRLKIGTGGWQEWTKLH